MGKGPTELQAACGELALWFIAPFQISKYSARIASRDEARFRRIASITEADRSRFKEAFRDLARFYRREELRFRSLNILSMLFVLVGGLWLIAMEWPDSSARVQTASSRDLALLVGMSFGYAAVFLGLFLRGPRIAVVRLFAVLGISSFVASTFALTYVLQKTEQIGADSGRGLILLALAGALFSAAVSSLVLWSMMEVGWAFYRWHKRRLASRPECMAVPLSRVLWRSETGAVRSSIGADKAATDMEVVAAVASSYFARRARNEDVDGRTRAWLRKRGSKVARAFRDMKRDIYAPPVPSRIAARLAADVVNALERRWGSLQESTEKSLFSDDRAKELVATVQGMLAVVIGASALLGGWFQSLWRILFAG